MQSNTLDELDRFVITDYQRQRPFASFLPGLAGLTGIPMWVFYVNRGQAIAGFGVESKDSPIMEFQSANKAYQMTPWMGFRTFIKLNRCGLTATYEPFSPHHRDAAERQQMAISANRLDLEEVSSVHGLQTNVGYFTLPGECFAGLTRWMTVTNTGDQPVTLEILDGLPAVIPYGVNNDQLKAIGRTVEAWMEVFNLPTGVPFYRVRASITDKVEVETYQAGHFAFGLAMQHGDSQLLPALVDPAVVFGNDTAFFAPDCFYQQPVESLLSASQVTVGRTPCSFFAHKTTLAPADSATIISLYGHIAGLDILRGHLHRIAQPQYFIEKAREAGSLVNHLTDVVDTFTASPVFDAYCRQNFLDNVLRGGWPVLLGDPCRPHVYHVFSRKHGDLERDYNAFVIAPEPYSQGETSYRDVIQNRRDEVLFAPDIGDHDIRTFLGLIQSDGYNPRSVSGSVFTLSPEKRAAVLAQIRQHESLARVLAEPFSPGKLLKHIAENGIELPIPVEAFLTHVLANAEQHQTADFHEGYWIDHWEYNLDLIESYLAVYPDRQDDLLFGRADVPFFDSAMVVQPRARKYVLANGVPHQIGSLTKDREKETLMASRHEHATWMRTAHGCGNIYCTTVFAKLTLIVLLKFATLDPWGMGIEMEASRPGWDDALNGLPALFGSGMSETYELQRWVEFLRNAVRARSNGELALPMEAIKLLREVASNLEAYNTATSPDRDHNYWDAVSTARETYREHTRLGFDGAEKSIAMTDLDGILAAFHDKIAAGIARALALNNGLPPTYFTYMVESYKELPEMDAQGRAYIQPLRFTPRVLPLFLEGPVRAFKVLEDAECARTLYRQIKASPLYDLKLKMYKINDSLIGESIEIGRARAFPPGWLENESIWLHMEYKYLLEVLKAGLHEEFFADAPHTLIPFLDPQQYGRSTLENSSFLVSSAHPDESMHGAGFVSRLSGSTAEFISIWLVMMAGKRPFLMYEGELRLALQPALPGWLFTKDGLVSFRFLGRCDVTYHNPWRLDLFGGKILAKKCELRLIDDQSIEIAGHVISAPYAAMVREGQVKSIDIWF